MIQHEKIDELSTRYTFKCDSFDHPPEMNPFIVVAGRFEYALEAAHAAHYTIYSFSQCVVCPHCREHKR